MKDKKIWICLGIATLALVVSPNKASWAQSQSPNKTKAKAKKPTSPPKAKESQTTSDKAPEGESKGYDKIRQGAEISHGLFELVKNKDDYYYGIPCELLERDFLVVNKLARVPKELNEAGVNRGVNYENKMIRLEWDKQRNKLLVRESRPRPKSHKGDAIALAVDDNYISPLIHSLAIEGVRPDSGLIMVKVNSLYDGTDTSLNNVFDNINLGTSAIKDLSRVQRIKSFENNVVAYSELTTRVREGNSSVNVSVEVHSSIMLLPKEVWPGRPVSRRVGYFSVPQLYYSDSQHQVEKRQLITRWRMEPKEGQEVAYLSGQIVEPRRPIVFYIDSSTPKAWKRYIKEGIEAWQVAFERAGFRSAIVAREIDGSCDEDDVNYSRVTYVASEKKNAMGPSLLDPRSGEILEADIIWWHNVVKMLKEWIQVQIGTTDPRAKGKDIPEELMGEAIRFVACHEVGHSLGLRHNMIASNAFEVAELRSPAFTDKVRATAASIMDYARFNYVAQPQDGVKYLTPGIGEYDKFAIEYGYRWFGDKAEDARRGLDSLLSKYKGKEYRYSEAQDTRDAVDPRAQIEDLGDDAIEASRLGIANLKRLIPEVVARTTTGEVEQSYERASELYYGIIYQWNNYLYHVLSNVGGFYIDNTSVGDGQASYTPVERKRQRAAVDFLCREIFTYPEWLFGAEVGRYTYLLRDTPNGVQENAPSQILQNTQAYLLWDILSNRRLMRLMEQEAQLGDKAYTSVELSDALFEAIFRRVPQPDARGRSLQKNMVDALLTATAEAEAVKINKKIGDTSLPTALELHSDWCMHGTRGLDGSPRQLNFYGSQLERISDAISVKRGVLLKIKHFALQERQRGNTANRYHYEDLVLRINTALGIK